MNVVFKYVLAILLGIIGLVFCLATLGSIPRVLKVVKLAELSSNEYEGAYIIGTISCSFIFGLIAFYSIRTAIRIFKKIKGNSIKSSGSQEILDSN